MADWDTGMAFQSLNALPPNHCERSEFRIDITEARSCLGIRPLSSTLAFSMLG